MKYISRNKRATLSYVINSLDINRQIRHVLRDRQATVDDLGGLPKKLKTNKV